MKNQLRPLLVVFASLTLVTGLLYPMLVTGLAQLIFPFQANGSLLVQNDEVVGSELIGQNFSSSGYFWGRPSATYGSPYNSFDLETLTGSSASNLGPLSKSLVDMVAERVDFLQKADPTNSSLIPVDLVTASGSGLDPQISVSAALYQVQRVAMARGLSESEVNQLVNQYIETRQFGLLGEPRVNVLLLNLALDGIQ